MLFTGLLLALFSPFTAVSGQELVVRGGPSILAGPASEDVAAGAIGAHLQVGARFWLSDLFQVHAGVGYDDRTTFEAALHVRPFSGDMAVEPYVFGGVGTQFVGGERAGIIPAGIGMQYDIGPASGVFFELAGRWHYRKNPVDKLQDFDFHVVPTAGAVYRFGQRPAPPVRVVRGEEPPPGERLASADPQTQPQQDPEPDVNPHERWGNPVGVVDDLGDVVSLPDGTFIMGLTDEDPLRLQTAGLKRVTVSGFFFDKFEVSNELYREWLETLSPEDRAAMMPDGAAWDRARSSSTFDAYFESGRFDDYPVVAVTWQQADRFCADMGGRLPTEAEWEYAARSGQPGGIFPWTGFEARAPDGTYLANFNPGRGLYAADGYAFTAPIDAFPSSPWGLHHMAGNAAEWVADTYTPSYAGLSNFNPLNEDPDEERRVVRGGSWASEEFFIGVGVRDAQPANEASIYTGFRCAYDHYVTDAAPSEE